MKRGPNALAGLFFVFVGALGQPAPGSSQAASVGLVETQAAAESLYSRAKAAQRQDDLVGAEKYFQQSLLISERLVPDSLAVARSLNGLGDVAQQRGMPPDAEPLYKKALAILQKLDPSGADAANSLDGLARAASDRGDVAKSEEYALPAFAIRQQLDSNNLDFALSLNTMAAVYNERAQPDKAEESFKKALSIQERLAPDSLALAQTMTNLARFCFSRRRYDEGETYHRKAWMIREKIAPDGLAVADSLRWLGLCARNNFDEAERYLRAALAIQEKLAPGSVHVAVTLSLFSASAHSRGDWLAAEGYDRKMLATWEKLAPHGARVRSLMVDLSNALVWRGDLAGAEEVARRALEENRKVNSGGKDIAWGLYTLGNIAMARGDLLAADDYYHQALGISQRVDPGGIMLARMMRGLGMIAEKRGDLEKAEDYYRRYLAVWEKISPNSDNVAQGLFTVGCVAHDKGNTTQAERYYQRALAIWTKTAPEGLFMAQVLGKLGQLSREQGDLASAEEYLRRAIAIEQKRTPRSPDLAQGLAVLGDILIAKGELLEALERHQQALAIREELLSGTEDHAASLAALAGIMRRQNQLDAAAQYYQQALDALENQAARLGSGDELRAGFRARHASYYKDYIDLLVAQKRFELAFQVQERFRARTLLETLAVARAEIHKGADPALLQQQRVLQQSLAAKTRRRIQLLGEKTRNAELAVLDKEIQDLHSQYQEVEERLRASNPSYAALTRPQPLTAAEIQQLLDPDTLLLEYSMGEERSYIFAVTPESLTVHELPKRAELESRAKHLYELLTARNRHVQGENAEARQRRIAKSDTEYVAASSRLSAVLLGPFVSDSPHKRLVVIADGALQYLPFATLPEPHNSGHSGPARTFTPLIAEREIVQLPSASVLAILRKERMNRQPASRQVAVIADPVFDARDIRVRRSTSERHPGIAGQAVNAALESDSARMLTRSLDDANLSRDGALSLPRLLFTRREAAAIIALTPGGMGKEAVDFDANRRLVLSAELARYRVVHFATHALVDNVHPELSGLVLSLVDQKGKAQDGFLGLEDIYNLDLAADLVVLSACDTALGKQVDGEGMIGLARGFMYAGASDVMGTLWKVEDFATSKFMKAFYTAMEQNRMPAAQALRQAQLALWKEKHWSAPYYWAAFTLQGDWR